MLRNIPVLLLLITLIIILLASWIPLSVYQNLYAISLTIKSCIIVLLPLIIFGLLLRATINLANNASLIIGLILLGVCVSSFLALLLSKFIGGIVYNLELSIYLPDPNHSLKAAWNCDLPKLIDNSVAMLAGILLGVVTGWQSFAKYKKYIIIFSTKLDLIIAKFFKCLVYVIPLFVTGFIAKLQYDGIIKLLIKDYTVIFGILVGAQVGYVLFAYFIFNKFKYLPWIKNLKNMLPAAISGFSTMSSAASLPLTILGVENSVKLKDLARSVVPATVNIHLVGDCFTTPILAYAVIKNYAIAQPLFTDYLLFSFYFIVAKFSVAALPGGGIIVMLPVLGTYFSFNSEMMSLITALYILFDPINTAINILGNGAFAKMLDNLVCCVPKISKN